MVATVVSRVTACVILGDDDQKDTGQEVKKTEK